MRKSVGSLSAVSTINCFCIILPSISTIFESRKGGIYETEVEWTIGSAGVQQFSGPPSLHPSMSWKVKNFKQNQVNATDPMMSPNLSILLLRCFFRALPWPPSAVQTITPGNPLQSSKVYSLLCQHRECLCTILRS